MRGKTTRVNVVISHKYLFLNPFLIVAENIIYVSGISIRPWKRDTLGIKDLAVSGFVVRINGTRKSEKPRGYLLGVTRNSDKDLARSKYSS
jgi:hypothetical protein